MLPTHVWYDADTALDSKDQIQVRLGLLRYLGVRQPALKPFPYENISV